ncbi:YqxA family protein [Calidifontibacillus erzurumensis]|uniref:YqxA family protein n=1 Tax=Calidifontibacillus erzurumensis TaxID=2741433 RepID=A0A8J8GDL6_9BACI|nr:YqxA family protein [Calidifontibacillus erzurumensis]NSL50270.1 YqxA family protein [Calidifontibacillus erzurumensis]
MKKFIGKCLLLSIILFFGVLLGMQKANEGLLEMKGFDDQTFAEAFHFKKNEDGTVGASVLGNEITAHDLEEKQKMLEEMKAYHVLSNIGLKLADLLGILFQSLVHFIVITLDKFLSFIG